MGKTAYILTPRDNPKLFSLVIPIYNEEEVLLLLAARLEELLAKLPCHAEVILVNDGSSDGSIQKLHEISQRDKRFKVLCFARNFGHQIAATAGLDAASGDAVVLMDADLQDPPELIFDMLARFREGYDVVYAQRVKRAGEPLFKRWSAWIFYRLMATLVYKELPLDTGDYRLISRRCLNALLEMRETHRFLRGMVSWVGFPQIAQPFVRPPRAAGETKYPLRKMLKFAWTAAVSFSPAPLRASFLLGFMLIGVGVAYAIYALIRVILGLYLVRGWASLILLNCVIGGALMICIGVLGEYVARIFEEIKGRPLYIVSERYNFDTSEEKP
ncbi:MAG TPA: glycosyltransferase family 2 protein [Bryobacteraceae bacterium]|nr:glycosyltransferase family 2 protein [Bryobacteraceae bacterium]